VTLSLAVQMMVRWATPESLMVTLSVVALE
jgi:hypothetical protein